MPEDTGRLVRQGKSRIHAAGAFAKVDLPARRKIGELTGELIRHREARRRAREHEAISIVEFTDGWAIDATNCTSPLRALNHSCDPNCYIRCFRHHVEFYTRRAIKRGEELTADYGETHHEGKVPCKCGSANCRGFL